MSALPDYLQCKECQDSETGRVFVCAHMQHARMWLKYGAGPMDKTGRAVSLPCVQSRLPARGCQGVTCGVLTLSWETLWSQAIAVTGLCFQGDRWRECLGCWSWERNSLCVCYGQCGNRLCLALLPQRTPEGAVALLGLTCGGLI